MVSLPNVSFSVEMHNNHQQQQQQQQDLEDSGRTERAKWLINSPEPPYLWQELVSGIRKNVFPHRGNHSLGAMSFFQALFPILSWGKTYNASKLKDDFMAGLTLASLSIPQVQI